MKVNTGKILKTILFIGLFVYCVYPDIKSGEITLIGVLDDLFAASLVYLIASLFGFTLSACGNFIIALIITVGITMLLAYKFDEVVAKVSWLDTERAAMIVAVVVTLWVQPPPNSTKTLFC